jgi:hypothetical protein
MAAPTDGMYFDEVTERMRIREVPISTRPTLLELTLHKVLPPIVSIREPLEYERKRIYKDENAEHIAHRIIDDYTTRHSDADIVFRELVVKHETKLKRDLYFHYVAAHAILSNCERPGHLQTKNHEELVRYANACLDIAHFATARFLGSHSIDEPDNYRLPYEISIVRLWSFLYFCFEDDTVVTDMEAMINTYITHTITIINRPPPPLRPDEIQTLVQKVVHCVDTFWHIVTDVWLPLVDTALYEKVAYADLIALHMTDNERRQTAHALAPYLRRSAAYADRTGPLQSPRDVYLQEKNIVYHGSIHADRYQSKEQLIMSQSASALATNRWLRVLYFACPLLPTITQPREYIQLMPENTWLCVVREHFHWLVYHVHRLYIDDDPYRNNGYSIMPRPILADRLAAAVIAHPLVLPPPPPPPAIRVTTRIGSAVDVLQSILGTATPLTETVKEIILQHFVPGGRPLEQQYTQETLLQHADDAKHIGQWRVHEIVRFYFMLSDQTVFLLARAYNTPSVDTRNELLLHLLVLVCDDIVAVARNIYHMQLRYLPATPTTQYVWEDMYADMVITKLQLPAFSGARPNIIALVRRWWIPSANVDEPARDRLIILFRELERDYSPATSLVNVLLLLFLFAKEFEGHQAFHTAVERRHTPEILFHAIKFALLLLLGMEIDDLVALVQKKQAFDALPLPHVQLLFSASDDEEDEDNPTTER